MSRAILQAVCQCGKQLDIGIFNQRACQARGINLANQQIGMVKNRSDYIIFNRAFG